ncbi:MAG: hypothetical protein Tp152SUR00d2C52646391_48 [Prokaryotic dsDNA virus sp.]|nr:MAG: hypothetical protein Tp152SUR00d2C52646391_48 [Prokaryotic dsDNA virus sp.]|tara:strand:- start:2754 stop:3029 length:276 start_codon:yes stop_codon:yes gene_type:complete
MAVSKKSNQTQAEKQSRVPARGNRSQPEVIAYWNPRLKDKQGNEHSLPKGVPLTGIDRATAAMIRKAEQDPDHVFTLTGTIQFIETDDIEL